MKILENLKLLFRNNFNEDRFLIFLKEHLFKNQNINNVSFDITDNLKENLDNKLCEKIYSFIIKSSYSDKLNNNIYISIITIDEFQKDINKFSDLFFRLFYGFCNKNNNNKNLSLMVIKYINDERWHFAYLDATSSGNKKFDYFLLNTKEYDNLELIENRFLKIIELYNENFSIKEIENIFCVKELDKEFFKEYKSLYQDLANELDCILRNKNNQNIKDDFTEKIISTKRFSNKILSQIIFIYFLQKLGLFIHNRKFDKNIIFSDICGQGSKNFLKDLFDECIKLNKNFFNEYLEPLFYEGLSQEHKNNYYSRLKCYLPFLNGGIFSPLNNYDWNNTDIEINNHIFKKIIDKFNEYDFTIKEGSNIAIDPEMLGKIFEGLLNLNERGEGGVFYTPREIVRYICIQSLIEFLYLKLDKKIQYDKIKDFVDKNKYDDIDFNLSIEIDEILKNIKICDPAVGSGAFPVEMIDIISNLRLSLNNILKRKYDIYSLKLNCIERCIYGVDIMEEAVDIARLRLWFSLILSETNYKFIKPLPNLDFKIICGNTLDRNTSVISNDMEDGIKINSREELFSKEIELNITKIIEIQNEYVLCKNQIDKKQKSEKIKKLMEEIGYVGKFNDVILFNFINVFFKKNNADNCGFDIIIGNPPYKTSIKIDDKMKNDYRNKFHYDSAIGNYDLYFLFLERALSICNKKGIIGFIMPYKWINNKLGYAIRNKIFSNDKTKIIKFINISSLKFFSDARGALASIMLFYANEFRDNFYYHSIFKPIHERKNAIEIFNNEINNNDFYCSNRYKEVKIFLKHNYFINRNDYIDNIVYNTLLSHKNSRTISEIFDIKKGLNLELEHKYKIKNSINVDKNSYLQYLNGRKSIFRYKKLTSKNEYIYFPYKQYLDKNIQNFDEILFDNKRCIDNSFYIDRSYYMDIVKQCSQEKIVGANCTRGGTFTIDYNNEFYYGNSVVIFIKKIMIIYLINFCYQF